MARLLNARGVTSTPVTADDRSLLGGILESFRNGAVSVLCCTGVLGRGFHVIDIRFVFHASVPLDLTEYIQQTGRAGRDGKRAHCVLFYRAQDFESVRRIKLQQDDSDLVRESVERDIAEVASYAMSCECRYSQLARTATIDECLPSDQRCNKDAPCGNCTDKSDKIDFPLAPIFDSIHGGTIWEFETKQNSLSDDLLQLFLKSQVLGKQSNHNLRGGPHFGYVRDLLSSGSLRFFVRMKKRDLGSSTLSDEFYHKMDCKILQYDENELLLMDRLMNAKGLPGSSDRFDQLRLPFLLRFEAERYVTLAHTLLLAWRMRC